MTPEQRAEKIREYIAISGITIDEGHIQFISDHIRDAILLDRLDTSIKNIEKAVVEYDDRTAL